MNIEPIIQSDDSNAFLEVILQDPSSYTNYSLKGSKNHCIFCKCAYLGSDSCLEAALASDIICNHSEKNASYFAASGNKISTLILLSNYNTNFKNAVLGAIKYGNYQAFMWLLENNYDITMKDLQSNPSILLKCAKGGNAQIFQYLIQNFPQYLCHSGDLNPKDNKCHNIDSLLQISTKYNNTDIVNLILLQPEYQNIYDIIPLLNSIQHKNVEITKKLLNVTKLNKSAQINLFDAAIDSKCVDIIVILAEKFDISLKGVIFKAVCSNSVDFVRQILEKGIVDINEKNEYGVLF